MTQINAIILEESNTVCQNLAKNLYLYHNTTSMAHNDFKRYIWLISLLYNTDGASFSDIDLDWQDQPELNPEGESLPNRTFHNHIKAIKEIFGFSIAFSNKDRKYHISDDLYSGRTQQALLLMSSLSLWNSRDSYSKMAGRILYEEEPYVYPKWIQRIIAAMDSDKIILIEYMKYGDRGISRKKLCPYFMKMIKRRWYLIAREGEKLKTFALDDRTKNVQVLDESFEYPADFNPEEYLRDAFGIRTAPPKRVVLKAYGQEADYLRSTPMHPSQKEIATESDHTVFSLQVGTNAWEFYQEILSHGNRIEILEPLSLRKDIASKIDEMRDRYAEFWQ